jgi:3-hydroxyacyl-CoA dehydrogenase
VVEAIVKDLATKQALFGELDTLCSARAVLASNTSSLLPSALAERTSHPERLLVVGALLLPGPPAAGRRGGARAADVPPNGRDRGPDAASRRQDASRAAQGGAGFVAGLDIWQTIAAYLFPLLSDAKRLSALLAERAARGDFGVTSGRGFYEWTPGQQTGGPGPLGRRTAATRHPR